MDCCGAAFHPLSPLPSLLFISLHDNQCESPGRPVKHISPCWFFFLISLTFPPPRAPVLLLVRLSRRRQQVNVIAGCHMLTRRLSSHVAVHNMYVCLCEGWGRRRSMNGQFCCCREVISLLKVHKLICTARTHTHTHTHTHTVSANHLIPPDTHRGSSLWLFRFN